MNITKSSGEVVPFQAEKLKHSLKKAGASDEQLEKIYQELQPLLVDGISTKKIYKMAFELLKKKKSSLAARYQLKQAIMDLGPSGYSFEKYIAALWHQLGYQAKTNQMIKGNCINHEIDVLAENKNTTVLMECKFHNQHGTMTDVKVPLYVHARFQDVWRSWQHHPSYRTKKTEGWLVTNTRFTSEATQYARCVGLKLLGWDYPQQQGLKDLIDDLGLYPITCLTTLTKTEKQRLLEKIVLCKEILQNPAVLEELTLSLSRYNHVIEEASILCSHY
ncbi:MAG: ATP cone domain-containing protein [Flammeovirgaceae bacterium]|nr:ATP cone domain-containing protein [Flammeovirgaceae bacterium]MDW8286805.1 ATP cone domain-containing protein [Flammeovirgaceae bacterium]